MQNSEIFRMVTQSLEKSKKGRLSGIAVFDLDSTLFNVSLRTQQILREFSIEHQSQWPKECESLREVEIFPHEWGIKEPLGRIQLTSTPHFYQALKVYWMERFFSSSHLKHDRPYPGAIEFVQALFSHGIDVRYLTGRDQVRMGPGTMDSLRAWSLPTDPPSRLNLKPNTEITDTDFKTDFFGDFDGDLSSTWFFENEPVIIEKVRKAHPELNIVFVDTVHSGRAQAPEGLPSIKASVFFK